MKNILKIKLLLLIIGCYNDNKIEVVSKKIINKDSFGLSLELSKLKQDTSFGEFRKYNYTGIVKNNSNKPVYLLASKGKFYFEENKILYNDIYEKNGKTINCFSFPINFFELKLLPKDSQICFLNVYFKDSSDYRKIGLAYMQEHFELQKSQFNKNFLSKINYLSINIHQPSSIICELN